MIIRSFAPAVVRPRLLQFQRRSFFASSTDHTRLLADAEIHRISNDNNNNDTKMQYVLVAHGTDMEMVQKVPQLHLARLFLDSSSNIMYGAKVVNRTLGNSTTVCGKLVDAARQDGAKQAHCTLHGMTEFVMRQQSGDDGIALLAAVSEDYYSDNEIKLQWETIAKEFVAIGECEEANLYRDNGGVLTEILHHQDKSVFADTCGGAMALFDFE